VDDLGHVTGVVVADLGLEGRLVGRFGQVGFLPGLAVVEGDRSEGVASDADLDLVTSQDVVGRGPIGVLVLERDDERLGVGRAVNSRSLRVKADCEKLVGFAAAGSRRVCPRRTARC
jgi:hypothetical protein